MRDYSIISELANVSYDSIFVQRLHRNINESASSLRRFLSSRERTVNRVAVTRTGSRGRKIFFDHMVAAKLQDTETQFLGDSGVIPNVMSAAFAKAFSITPIPTDRDVYMLDGKRSDSDRSLVDNVPVTFGDLTVPINLIDVAGSPHDVLVENCRNRIDIGLLRPLKQFVLFTHSGKIVQLNNEY